MFALSAGTVRRNIFVFLTVLGVITIIAAAPYYFGTRAADGRTQHLNSPDDVPEGLTSEDWQGIRAAYEANSGITAIAQQAYLKPAAVGTTQADDWFGWSVAVSDDTVIVGAFLEDSSTTGVNSTANEGSGDSGAAYTIADNGGANRSGTQRRLKDVGTNYINYAIAPYAATGTGAGRATAITLNLNGTINNADYINAVAGAYSDVVTFTINP